MPLGINTAKALGITVPRRRGH